MLIPIADIKIGRRLRRLRESLAQQLMQSITENGLREPILVARRLEKRGARSSEILTLTLVLGYHRLEAVRRLGWSHIEARVLPLAEDECLIREIDDNIMDPAGLTLLERCEHLVQQRRLYERQYPNARGAVHRAHGMHLVLGRGNASAVLEPTFAQLMATQTSESAQTIRRNLRRIDKLSERLRDRIATNPAIANSGIEMDALASAPPTVQKKALDLVESGRASGVRAAIKMLTAKSGD